MYNVLVSVVICTKNRSKLVLRAVNSVLFQSYSNIELIILDLSSDDKTAMLVNSIDDNRIVYERIVNETSAADTVNHAVFASNGKFIAFCDDDDEWVSINKLEKQLQLFDSLDDEYAVVSCGWELWDDGKDQHICYDYPKARGYVFQMMLVKNVYLGTPTLLIKKDAFIRVGGFEDGLRYSADYLLLCKLSQYYKFDFVQEILVLGHENHPYGSQQKLVNSSYNYRDKVAYYVRFLEKFGKDYNDNESAKTNLLETIVTISSKGSLTREFALYSRILLIHNPLSLILVLKRLFQLVYRNVLNLFRL